MTLADLPRFDPTLAERLRAEALEMASAYVATLLLTAPPNSITGIYLKGSVCRPWDSLIDYVPELSDVDMHVKCRSEADHIEVFESLKTAMRITELVFARYQQRVPDSHHLPRPQVFSMNELEKLPGYIPSRADNVRTLHGERYAAASRADYATVLNDDARRFSEDAKAIGRLASSVIDRPGPYAWHVVQRLVWRVGPTGPRVLTQLGMDPYEAWGLNRTRVVEALTDHSCGDIAEAYADFYLAGWEGFRSGFRDPAEAGRAINAVDRLFSLSQRVMNDSHSDS